MLQELHLHPVPIDGCATGLTDKNSIPLYKPWLIAVSSAPLIEELKDFRCDKSHEHGKTAGDETARTAYYPRALCEALHRGLDAHDLHRQGGDMPAAIAEAGNQTPLTSVTGFGPGGNQPSAGGDMSKTKHKEASVPGAPSFGPGIEDPC